MKTAAWAALSSPRCGTSLCRVMGLTQVGVSLCQLWGTHYTFTELSWYSNGLMTVRMWVQHLAEAVEEFSSPEFISVLTFIQCLFHPSVTTVACKRKCSLQPLVRFGSFFPERQQSTVSVFFFFCQNTRRKLFSQPQDNVSIKQPIKPGDESMFSHLMLTHACPVWHLAHS